MRWDIMTCRFFFLLFTSPPTINIPPATVCPSGSHGAPVEIIVLSWPLAPEYPSPPSLGYLWVLLGRIPSAKYYPRTSPPRVRIPGRLGQWYTYPQRSTPTYPSSPSYPSVNTTTTSTMATATQSRPAGNAYPQHAYRHHPYTQATRPQSNGPKWHTANPSTSSAASSSTAPRIHTSTPHHRVDGKKQQSPPLASTVPPSPPRSMRDASETPSAVGLGVAFGGKSGGKWWDEELVSGSNKGV